MDSEKVEAEIVRMQRGKKWSFSGMSKDLGITWLLWAIEGPGWGISTGNEAWNAMGVGPGHIG